MVKLPENEDTPEKRVNRIFNQMDTVLDTLLILDLIKEPETLKGCDKKKNERKWHNFSKIIICTDQPQ